MISASEFGFTLEDEPQFESNQSFLSIGCYKNVGFIEGPGGQGKESYPGLTVACKKSAFHCTELVSDKALCYVQNIDVSRANEIKKLSNVFKGVCNFIFKYF